MEFIHERAGGLTSASSRRYYRRAPAKALVILACLARIGVFDTRNAAAAQAVGKHNTVSLIIGSFKGSAGVCLRRACRGVLENGVRPTARLRGALLNA